MTTNQSPTVTTVCAPFAGVIRDLSDTPDEVFSAGLMGPGFALEPLATNSECPCLSPSDGEIAALMAHAYVVKNGESAVLVHCGIDTVHLGDDWSQIYAHLGDKVSSGDIVLVLDWSQVLVSGHCQVSPIVGVEAESFTFNGQIQPGDTVQAGEQIGSFAWA